MLGCELLKIGDMLRCCRILKQYLTNDVPSDWEGNLALEMGRMIAPSREVEDAISRAIVSEDEISDHASRPCVHPKHKAEAGQHQGQA